MNRWVRLPCPREDEGEVNVFLTPQPHDPLGWEGWHAWIWAEPGPRGGERRLPHCSVGHRLYPRELQGVLQRAVGAYLDYLEEGGGLTPPGPPEP